MSSAHVAIAEALKDAINGFDLPKRVVARRRYPARKDRAEMVGLEVFVYPLGHTWEYKARDNSQTNDFAVQILIRFPLSVVAGEYDQEQMDGMIHFCEALIDAVADAGKMNGYPLVAGDQAVLVDPEQLDQQHVFYAPITFTYRG